MVRLRSPQEGPVEKHSPRSEPKVLLPGSARIPRPLCGRDPGSLKANSGTIF